MKFIAIILALAISATAQTPTTSAEATAQARSLKAQRDAVEDDMKKNDPKFQNWLTLKEEERQMQHTAVELGNAEQAARSAVAHKTPLPTGPVTK